MNDRQHHNSVRALKFYQLLSPKHWLTWLVIFIFYCLCQLPYRMQLSMGRGFGTIAYFILRKRRHIANTNLRLCFPELGSVSRKNLLKASFKNLGMSVMETGMSWWRPVDKLPPVTIEGMEHAEKAISMQKGILLLGPHFTTIDMIARTLSRHYALHVVGRHQNNPVFDALLKRSRDSRNITLIDRKNLRGIINALRDNKYVWYAPDQDYGKKRCVFAPFFKIAAASITVPCWIAEQSESPVLFVAYYRLPNYQGYKIVIHPLLENFPSGQVEQDMTRVNQLIEKAIREYPEQYLWIHRRFKTRPEGEADCIY